MLDYIKIQTQFLKDMANEKKSNFIRVGNYKDYTYISNQFIAYRIPNNCFYLDSKKLREMNMQQMFLHDVSREWFITNNIIKYSDIGNKFAYEFKDKDDNKMYIDKKIFDTLNLKSGDNYCFYAKENGAIMKIVQNNEVIAVVCPVRVKG